MKTLGTVSDITSVRWSVDGILLSLIPNGSTSYSTARTLSLPNRDGDDTLAALGTVQTFSAVQTFTAAPVLTSKTLTIGDQTVTVPEATDTLMGKATTDTMTNKTFDADGTGNVLSNVENANIKAAAAIAYSKLNLAGSIDAGDLATIDYLQFNNNIATPSHSHGLVNWNQDDKTLELHTEVSGTKIQLGQEQVVRGKNNTAETLTNGTVIYINGTDNGTPTFALADADNITGLQVIGMVTNSIAVGAEGYATTRGLVRDLDTSGVAAAGLPVFLSSTAGEFTNTPPSSPAILSFIGVCQVKDASIGVIYVDLRAIENFGTENNVGITGAADGDLMQYDAASSKWINSSILAQYAFLLGRSGGQVLYGGADASDNLTLTSTLNATKGSIVTSDDLIPGSDGDKDLGSTAAAFAEVHGNKLLLKSNSQTTTVAGSPSASASVDYILPPADGSNGQALKTAGDGTTSWGDVAGGGLIPVEVDHTYATTLAAGNHYMVDMSGAAATVTLDMPAGASEAVIAVSVFGIVDQTDYATTPYYVEIDANGAETFEMSGGTYDDIELGSSAGTVVFTWDAGYKWIANVSDLFTPNSFAGVFDAEDGIRFPNGGNTIMENYEEGNPSLTITAGAGFSGAATITSQRFTRYGNVVHVEALFNFGSASGNFTSATDYFTISSLPYNVVDAAATGVCTGVQNLNNNAIGQIRNGATALVIVQFPVVNGSSARTNQLLFNMTYHTA